MNGIPTILVSFSAKERPVRQKCFAGKYQHYRSTSPMVVRRPLRDRHGGRVSLNVADDAVQTETRVNLQTTEQNTHTERASIGDPMPRR